MPTQQPEGKTSAAAKLIAPLTMATFPSPNVCDFHLKNEPLR
jgi:hypothetical protein